MTRGPSPLLSHGEALAWLLRDRRPVSARRIALGPAAIGVALADDLRSDAPVPLRSLALRAGMAVRAFDFVGASPYGPVPLGDARAVAVGEALPDATDAILPSHAVERIGELAVATEPVAPGDGCRLAGADLPVGAVLRRKGERLRPLDIAAALAAGLLEAAVRRPRLALLGAPGAARVIVGELASRHGVEIVADPAGADLAVAIGPAPVGFLVGSGLALRPGEEGRLGAVGTTPALLLPDRVADALAVSLALIAPVIAHLAGLEEKAPPAGRLARKLSSTVGFAELALLRESASGFDPLAIADLPLSALAAATHWTVVPADSEGVRAGDDIPVTPL